MITFVVYIRKDSEERIKNLEIVLPYYKSILPESKFIFIEDDEDRNFEFLQDTSGCEYVNVFYEGIYNKSRSYNEGLKRCKSGIVCFLDIDCIVSKLNLLSSIKRAEEEKCICIGYNGVSVYFNYSVKNKLSGDSFSLYDFLDSFIDKKSIFTNYKNKNYLIGNTKAVGGCLLGKKEVFTEINGFNPNIKGWGYEDNEIVVRAHKLNVPVYYINTPKPMLFHLPHGDESTDKSEHPYYIQNQKLYNEVFSKNKKQMEDYISSWSLT